MLDQSAADMNPEILRLTNREFDEDPKHHPARIQIHWLFRIESLEDTIEEAPTDDCDDDGQQNESKRTGKYQLLPKADSYIPQNDDRKTHDCTSSAV